MHTLTYIASLPDAGNLFVVGTGFIVVALLLRKKLSAIEQNPAPKATPQPKES